MKMRVRAGAAVLLVVGAASPAWGGSHLGVGGDIGTGGDFTIGVGGATEGSGASPSAGGPGRADDGRVLVSYPVISTVAGEYCTSARGRRVAPEDVASVREFHNRSYFLQYDRITADGTVIAPCPGSSAPTIDPTPALEFAASIVDQLPRPAPIVEPGEALTGLRMHLELGPELTPGEPLTFERTRTLALGEVTVPVTVSAVGTYTVDWGDGSPVETHDRAGRGYREGAPAVTHVWQDRGTYSVTVQDTWVLTVRAEGVGTFTLRRTLTPRTRDVPVTEVQAVIVGD